MLRRTPDRKSRTLATGPPERWRIQSCHYFATLRPCDSATLPREVAAPYARAAAAARNRKPPAIRSIPDARRTRRSRWVAAPSWRRGARVPARSAGLGRPRVQRGGRRERAARRVLGTGPLEDPPPVASEHVTIRSNDTAQCEPID